MAAVYCRVPLPDLDYLFVSPGDAMQRRWEHSLVSKVGFGAACFLVRRGKPAG